LNFFILLGRTGPTYLGLGQTWFGQNSGDTLNCSHATWIVKSSPNEGEEQGKGKSSAAMMDWGTVETPKASHSPLFTCNVNSRDEETTWKWRRRRRRRKGRSHICLQWRCYPLFTLQNSGDGEAAKEKEGEGEGEREGRASVLLFFSLFQVAFIYKRIGSSLTSPRPEREAVEQRIQQAKRTEERKQHWLTSLFLTIIYQAAAWSCFLLTCNVNVK